MVVEQVFKAVSDPYRRQLLDSLARQDGQSLGELCSGLPLSRFGVMKHRDVLVEAGLITIRKVGRQKLHYINPAPIREIDAWLEQYRKLWSGRLDRLEDRLRAYQQKEQHDGNEQQ